MAQKSFIVIIGEYTPESNGIRDILKKSKEAEINIFALPKTDGKDIVERINEQLFIHHYAPLLDLVLQAKQYIRDIVALGAQKHYFCKSKDKYNNNLLDCIKRGLDTYGIAYIEL